VLAKVCGDFWTVVFILLLIALFFVYSFSITIRIVFAFVFDVIILVVLIHDGLEWACKYWSIRGMSGHKSAGPLKDMFDIFCRYTNMR
jgi:hypothetical protein